MDPSADEHHDDGTEELQLEEQQAYESVECPQSGDGNHQAESQEGEHLEGVQGWQYEQLKSEFVYSTQGTSLTKRSPNQASLTTAASHTGLDMRTSSPSVKASARSSRTTESSYLTRLQIFWMEFMAAINCCLFSKD